MAAEFDRLQRENEDLRSRVAALENAVSAGGRDHFLATLVENLYDGVTVVDAEGVIKYVSPSITRIVGYEPEQLVGRSYFELLHPDWSEELSNLMKDHIEHPGEWREAEAPFRHQNGGWRTLEARAVNLLEDPTVRGFLSIFRDVTEQRNSARAVEEANDRLRDLSTTVPGILYQMRCPRDHSRLEIPYVSDSVEQFFGVSPDEVCDDPWLFIDQIADEDKPRFYARFREASENCEEFSVEFRCRNNGDPERWMRTSSTSRVLPDGNLLYTGIAIDVTAEKEAHLNLQRAWLEVEQRVHSRTSELNEAHKSILQEIKQRERAENELRRVEEKLDEAMRLSVTAEMMTGVAHDLHQPLTAIANYAGGCLLRMERNTLEPDDQRRIFEEIKDSALRATEIVRRLRNFTKSQAIERRALEISDICGTAIMLARVVLRERDVEVETHYGEDVPLVLADDIPIAQVVLNLIGNAAEEVANLPRERRTIRLHTSNDAENGMVRVSVEDDGPGMPADRLETVFERFETSKADGLGLGLAICRSIVTLHEGRIWAESTLGEGCTFHFELPVAAGVALPSPIGAASLTR